MGNQIDKILPGLYVGGFLGESHDVGSPSVCSMAYDI